MIKREGQEILTDAEAAGGKYASDQINGDYFMDWVRDQLLEASRMDPSTVLPLETKSDAKQIARNMLQQLEWDMSRDLGSQEIARLIGEDGDEADFRKGLRGTLRDPQVRDWLADELLQINEGLRGGGVGEARREDRRRGPRTTRLTRSTAKPGMHVRVVDGDSMYRGHVGTIVEPDVRRLNKLDDYNRRFLKGEGTVLVERSNGSLFVIHARALERENENPIDRRERRSMNERPEPVDDPTYIIQGIYDGNTRASGFEEFGFDEEDVAIAEAKKIARSPHFEGDYVRVITRDSELVWDSRGPDASETRSQVREASDPNFQQGERLRIRTKGAQGQAFESFWYTVPYVISLKDVALRFSQALQPGMLVEIESNGQKWTFQKSTHAGRTAIELVPDHKSARRSRGGAQVSDPAAPRTISMYREAQVFINGRFQVGFTFTPNRGPMDAAREVLSITRTGDVIEVTQDGNVWTYDVDRHGKEPLVERTAPSHRVARQ